MNKKIVYLLIIILTYFACISCAPNPVIKADIERDIEVKKLVPPNNKALVYILCAAGQAKVTNIVLCNGKYLGVTSTGLYVYTILEPGNYLFTSQLDDTSKTKNKSEFLIVLEANKTYYLEQKIKAGWNHMIIEFERIGDSEGHSKMSECNLSLENVTYLDILKNKEKKEKTNGFVITILGSIWILLEIAISRMH